MAALLIAASLTLAACDLGGGDSEPESAATGSNPAAAAEPIRLDLLVYNVEYGGGPDTDRVMRKVDADVVGVLESYDRLPEIARNAGYPYYNVSLQLLSKYPIYEPSGGDGLYALIEVRPGYVIPFFNEHLDYVDWGPRALRNGNSVASVVRVENDVRTSALDQPVEAMRGLIDQGYPVFLTGDFNEPSSLDYGQDTVGTHKGIDEPVPWPVSERLHDLGFRDSYRDEHPDPVKEPGNTHRSGERIDFVYAAGASKTLDSKLIGDPKAADVDVGFTPWTSDHFAVLSTFDVAPVPMPTMVAVDHRLGTVGDPIKIVYNDPGSDGGSVEIVPEGGEAGSATRTLDAPGGNGTAKLDTSRMDPGAYEAVLVDGAESEVARVSFFLRDPDAVLELSTDRRTYAPGEPIEVSWEDGPANRWDWLGVYKAGASDPHKDSYTIWAYTGQHASGTVPPSTDGSVTLGPDTQGRPWPLPPGDYVVHYLLADQYNSAGRAKFTVSDGG